MCGFIGFCRKKNIEISELNALERVSNYLNHRGPDQKNYWFEKNIYFSHRRLSINDLSSDGIQPMISISKRFVILFNGEAYNFLELKKNFISKGVKFKGSSDTEVVLSLIENYGLEEALSKINGMFALAVLDKQKNKIYLSRDENGQKPLYYYIDDNKFFFTSELRGLKEIGINTKISNLSLNYFFTLSYVPAPLSIFENIFKVKRGEIIEFDIGSFKTNIFQIKRKINHFNLQGLSLDKKIDRFEDVFSEVINNHLISDVSNGTLLSGGIDSTLVTLFSNKSSQNKINSFCVKSFDDDYDEANFAEKIAKKIGTNHNTLEFSKADYFEVINKIHKIYDEPFGDSSQIPTVLLFNKVKNKIKVALSGDGGDEIFLGYNRYIFLNKYYDYLNYLNPSTRKMFSKVISSLPENFYDQISKIFRLNYFIFGNKITKVANSMNFENLQDFYFKIIRQDYGIENIIKKRLDVKSEFFSKINFSDKKNKLDNFQNADISTYLTDDIFVKVDRASMHSSIESRAPFVDSKVTDFANNLSIEDKINKKTGKLFLKKVLERYFDKRDFIRPKQGFGNPIGKLLLTDLKSWTEDQLNLNNENLSNYVNINTIQKLWVIHKSQKKDYSNILWNYLIFKRWLNENENI